MEVKVGVYTIHSEPSCMWITQEVKVKSGKNKGKVYEERVAGYVMNWEQLMEDFATKAYRRSGAKEVKQLLKDMDKRDKDIKALIKHEKEFA